MRRHSLLPPSTDEYFRRPGPSTTWRGRSPPLAWRASCRACSSSSQSATSTWSRDRAVRRTTVPTPRRAGALRRARRTQQRVGTVGTVGTVDDAIVGGGEQPLAEWRRGDGGVHLVEVIEGGEEQFEKRLVQDALHTAHEPGRSLAQLA